MSFYSPLRYPGGKGKIAKYIRTIIESNHILDGTYVEPFAGGCAVALELLLNEYVRRIVINDIDRAVYSFWYSVLNITDELCAKIENTSVSVDEWYEQKKVQDAENPSILDLGFSTFFLNRTNRSGILKGGVIGGIGQTGKWKIDARFNKKDLISRIKQIAAYKERISLFNCDAANFIREIIPRLPLETLVYIDPPYFNKGSQLYANYYKADDHHDLACTIMAYVHQLWIITYDNTPEIRNLYANYRQAEYILNYSASRPNKGSELMIYCKKMVIPDCTPR